MFGEASAVCGEVAACCESPRGWGGLEAVAAGGSAGAWGLAYGAEGWGGFGLALGGALCGVFVAGSARFVLMRLCLGVISSS